MFGPESEVENKGADMKQALRLSTFALTILIGASFPSLGRAAHFSNQFTEFELPAQWQCSLEGGEWVCQNTNEAKKKEALIVLAAKLKGDQDSLDQYLNFLKTPKTFTTKQGKPLKSDPKYAKTININGQAWVDSLHFESEIPGFYTRYLATVKQDIGVLITYSINKAKYQQYIDDFENITRTLKVFRKAGGINAAPQTTSLFQNSQPSAPSGNETVFQAALPNIQGGADQPLTTPAKTTVNPTVILGATLVLIGLILLSRKKSR